MRARESRRLAPFKPQKGNTEYELPKPPKGWSPNVFDDWTEAMFENADYVVRGGRWVRAPYQKREREEYAEFLQTVGVLGGVSIVGLGEIEILG